jgi:hypothetical protein
MIQALSAQEINAVVGAGVFDYLADTAATYLTGDVVKKLAIKAVKKGVTNIVPFGDAIVTAAEIIFDV